MTDQEFLDERDAVLGDLAASWRAKGVTAAQLLKLFPPPADVWVDEVDNAFAAPADHKPRADVGARDRLVRCVDATLRRPLIWFGQDRTDMENHRNYLTLLQGPDLQKLEAARAAPVHSAYQAYKGVRPAGPAAPGGALPPTAPDIEGPFYKAGAPALSDPADLSGGQPGAFELRGRVLNAEGGPVFATLDFWMADAGGDYDNDGYRLRGKVKTFNGRYAVRVARPGDYKISEAEYRCAHVHVKVTAAGYKPLTTQLYFPGDPYNATDHWYDKGREVAADGTFDFVLERL